MKHDRMDETLMMVLLNDGESVEVELDVEFTPDEAQESLHT